MLELPGDCVLEIMSFSSSIEVIKTFQFVSKNWYEAGNHHVLWKDVSIKTLHNRRFQGFLKTHGKHIKKITVNSLRLSRNASWKLIFHCSSLQKLDLTHCYSDSLIDEKFCFIISKLKSLRGLLLPNESKVNDIGFRHLSQLSELQLLQLKGNHYIVDFSPIKKMTKLVHLDLSSCVYVDNNFCGWIANFALEYLNLSYCYQVNMNGFESFFACNHPNLHTFHFFNINVNSNFVSSVLSKKCCLRRLTLNSLSINQEIYKSLSSFEHLKDLSIVGCAKIEDFRALQIQGLQHVLICRTSFITAGKKGLIEFAKKHGNVKVHLYDAYHLQHKDAKEVLKYDNIFLEYS